MGLELREFATVMRSPKRLELLLEIARRPFAGYKMLLEATGILSSEMYKHLRMMERYGLVRNDQTKWVITQKGVDFVNILNKFKEV